MYALTVLYFKFIIYFNLFVTYYVIILVTGPF